MSVPFYVSPEQIIKDKADYARKGIARGRSVVVLQYRGRDRASWRRTPHGPCTRSARSTTASPSQRSASTTSSRTCASPASGWPTCEAISFDRRDVTVRNLANAYAQTLGTIFTETSKPYEVELVVAEVGDDASGDQMYRLTFDGSVADEHGFVVMGGSAEAISAVLADRYTRGARSGRPRSGWGPRPWPRTAAEPRQLTPQQLEVAVLDRTRTQSRKFKRLSAERMAELLAPGDDG